MSGASGAEPLGRGGNAAPEAAAILHASAVAHRDRGLLLLGPSGSGKTTLALELLALGAELIADDRVRVARTEGPDGPRAILAPVPALAGLVELRGAGMLAIAPGTTRRARLWLAADLAAPADGRMPPARHDEIAGVRVRVLDMHDCPAAAARLWAVLRAGRHPDPEHPPAAASPGNGGPGDD